MIGSRLAATVLIGSIAINSMLYGCFGPSKEELAKQKQDTADSLKSYQDSVSRVEANRILELERSIAKTYSVAIMDDVTGKLESYAITKTHNLDQVFTGRNEDPYIHPEASDHAQNYGIIAVPVTSPNGLEGELQKVFNSFGVDDPINDPRYMEAANALGELNAHIGASRYPPPGPIPSGTVVWVPLPAGEYNNLSGEQTSTSRMKSVGLCDDGGWDAWSQGGPLIG